MDADTLAALKDSIAHWERLATGSRFAGERVGVADCALCAKFYERRCEGCPVAIATGLPACEGTPYEEAWPLYRWGIGADSDEFQAIAAVEHAFLQALLPESEQ